MGKLTCQDLMVGDWVEDGYKKSQVTSITCDGIVETTAAISNIEVVEPIKLTSDILVKNGFEKTKGGEYERTRYVMFSDKSWVALYTREAGGYSAFLNKIVVIHYVHQLQHLLRLCGFEKELTIN